VRARDEASAVAKALELLDEEDRPYATIGDKGEDFDPVVATEGDVGWVAPESDDAIVDA
jgi:hypothetical protein